MDTASQTKRVAEFVQDVHWEDLPADVQAQTIRCVLDLCGDALAGSRTKVAQLMADHAIDAYGSGTATVIGANAGSTPVGAALANGFAASALDLDDGYRPLKGHPGAVVFPAVLAAAEEANSTGAELLTALAIGYEVAMRVGLILHPLYNFYHGSGAWGPIGAAASAARLLGCDAERIWHALGVAEFHAPITPEMRSADHPSMLKGAIGWGAMVGLSSAQMAARGFTGVPSLFDQEGAGSAGSDLVESLGREFLMRRLYFKPRACCRWAQPAVEGALTAARELGVQSDGIARVRVHTFEAALHLRSTAPRTTEEAQLSLPWPVACALVDNAVGPDQVLEHGLADPARRALAARVEMVQDPEIERSFPDQALAWVEIEVSDGRRARSRVLAARGDADEPLPDAELVGKFRNLSDPALSPDRAEELVSAIQTLPGAASLGALIDRLRLAAPT